MTRDFRFFSFPIFLMSRAKQYIVKALPAAFIAGTVFGVGITSISAAIRGSAIFSDVPSSHYADAAIGEMYSLGIIKGLDDSHFGPDQPLTRGQAALLFQRLRNEIKGVSSTGTSSSRSSTSSSSSSSSVSSSTATSSTSSSYNPGGSVRFDSLGYVVEKNVSTGTLNIAIVRIGGNQGSGTVQYSFSGGTAVAGSDYTPASGTLTFTGKETSKKVTLQIKNNTSSSGDKTVILTLKSPTGSLSIGNPNTATVTIKDPFTTSSTSSTASSYSSSAPTGAVFQFSASQYGVFENGGNVTVTVSRTGVTTTAANVNYNTSNGSASSGSEYSSVNGTLSFSAGETSKTFVVPVVDNVTVDGNHSFNVVLSSPTNGASIESPTASVMIHDNESAPTGSGTIKLSAATYSVTMSSGKAVITVSHVGGGFGAVSVGYSTGNGTAVAGSDYVSTSGTLNFTTGEMSKTFTVPLISHSISNSMTFNVYISGGTGAPLGTPASAVVTINN